MRVCHVKSAYFDDPNLVSTAGLVPVMALAQRAGLAGLVEAHVSVPGPAGAHAPAKIAAVVAGMVAGADSFEDLAVVRHGAMDRLLPGAPAPTTLGTHLRAYAFGHVRRLDAVATRVLAALARSTPVLAGVGQVAWIDVDDTIKAMHGYAQQGVAYGYSKVKGLNAQLAVLSTPISAPVIAGVRLRKGNVASAHGAPKLIADVVATARRCGAAGLVTVRADSAYYQRPVVAAARAAGARISITARTNPQITKAITGIDADAWTAIKYPKAIFDSLAGGWVCDAAVAEVAFTAFTSRPKAEQVSARLIVRRVKRLNPAAGAGQGELFDTFRYHAIFTDSAETMLDAEAHHRDHAIVEQVIADLKNGPLAHLPSGRFTANAAWTTLATIAFNLTRAAATLAGVALAKATTATIRRHLIHVAARVACTARHLHLHLPATWPWAAAFTNLFEATCGPPPAAST
ncbi:MAG: IS1380 family transposase [Cellulomonas sp.]|nr:IS1380 family transposase [Cellulomonas sp.]